MYNTTISSYKEVAGVCTKIESASLFLMYLGIVRLVTGRDLILP